MFWSKLWLFLVTLVAGLAVAVALLAPRPLERDLEREAGARLERAQHAASLLLKVNARKWMDTAAQVANDAVLVESLEQASSQRGPADLTLVHRTVQERLRYFNDKMRVDLVLATDVHGRVIARAGLDEGEYKDGVEGFPLVGDALRGLRGDDTWSLGGKLYRVAASPVIARDKYVGALVVGQEVGNELAQSMKQVLETDVAFLLRGRVLAASAQTPVMARLPLLYDAQATEVQRSGHTPPLSIDAEGKRYIVVMAPFVGEASGHKAAFALLAPRPEAMPIGALVENLLQPAELKSLPMQLLLPVGGAVLIALVLGLVLLRLEADRPLKRMAREAQALARGELSRLDDDKHPGKLGTVARAVNTTLDRLASTARPQTGSVALRNAAPAVPPADAARPMPPPKAVPPAMRAAADAEPEGPSLFGELSDPGTGLPHNMPAGAQPQVKPTADLRGMQMKPTLDFRGDGSRNSEPLTTPKMQLPTLGDTDAQPTGIKPVGADGPDLIDAPNLGLPPLAPSGPIARRSDFEDEPTAAANSAGEMAKLVQAERRLASVELPLPPPVKPEEAALEAELQQVYHDFIETKQRLGESTDGVTYDKFVVKLKANRQQVITRYNCKTVKFQVYVKDGKAALKATPVT
jgi:hypothetical protein